MERSSASARLTEYPMTGETVRTPIGEEGVCISTILLPNGPVSYVKLEGEPAPVRLPSAMLKLTNEEE